MTYPRLAARLYNVPLLITPDKAEVLDRVFRAYTEGNASSLAQYKEVERSQAELDAGGWTTRTQGGYLRSGDGVALVQVLGSLVQRGAYMDAASGLESYSNIGAQLSAAMADPMVRGILLEIDSSGGEVAGLFDLASRVRSYDSVKPIVAHANENAFSAAYALGVAAGSFYVADTGRVGSVGVRMMHVDQSAYDAKRGIVYTSISAGERKNDGNPHEPLTDAALSSAQETVDRFYGIFLNHVAAMRGIDADSVRATEAGLLHPDQAMDLNMVDGVANLGGALQHLKDRISAENSGVNVFHNRAASAALQEQMHMAIDQKAPAAAPVPAVVTADQIAAERAAAFAEGQAKGNANVAEAAAAAVATGASAERARVAGILDHAEAAGRGSLAKHLAFKTTTSVDEAIAMFSAAPKEVAAVSNALAAAMAAVPNPSVGADAAGGEKDETKLAIVRILNAGKPKAA